MGALSKDEEAALAKETIEKLSTTQYACSSLEKLSGGTANFLYRGILLNALPTHDDDEQPTKIVVIKRSTDYVAVNRNFPLDITRCNFEEFMLHALADTSSFTGANQLAIVKAPRLFLFDQTTHTQVLEEFPDTTDLKTILQSPTVNDRLPKSSPFSAGRALGSWLRWFHNWTSQPAQAALVEKVGPNEGMRKLKRFITYDSFIDILNHHPELLDGCRKPLEEVRDAMRTEFETPIVPDKFRGLIHGDFWGGNVLLPNSPWQEVPDDTHPNKLFVIDWEMAQFGHRAIDIGSFLADMYERNLFHGVDTSIPIMQGFMAGYGPINEDLAFTTAIHTGVHLICWYYRRNRNSPLPHPLEKVLEVLRLGRDLVLKGWTRDREWLDASILAPLFVDDAA